MLRQRKNAAANSNSNGSASTTGRGRIGGHDEVEDSKDTEKVGERGGLFARSRQLAAVRQLKDAARTAEVEMGQVRGKMVEVDAAEVERGIRVEV